MNIGITIKFEGVEVGAVVAAIAAATSGVVELSRDVHFVRMADGRRWRVGHDGDRVWVLITEPVLDDLRVVREVLAAVRGV